MNGFLFSEGNTPVHIRYAYDVINSTKSLLESEFNLRCDGTGGSMADQISQINISFVANRRGSIDEARELIVRCTEHVTKSINSHELIRPYLAEYPFPSGRVHVSVGFSGPHGQFLDGTVSYGFQAKKQLHYFINQPIHQVFAANFQEPYEEALKIVQASTKTLEELRTHKEQPYEKEVDAFFEQMAKEIYKKWDVDTEKVGGEMRAGIKEFAFLLRRYKRCKTVEEARKLEVGITEMLLAKINGHEKLRPYLLNYPVQPGQIHVTILFREPPGGYKFRDGSLASVSQENNKIQYHKYEPVDDRKPILLDPTLVREESYTEAKELVFWKPKNNAKAESR